MHAALITGAGQLEVREFADPTPAEAGVVVEVMQRGYRSEDHVIRPARVVVSR